MDLKTNNLVPFTYENLKMKQYISLHVNTVETFEILSVKFTLDICVYLIGLCF